MRHSLSAPLLGLVLASCAYWPHVPSIQKSSVGADAHAPYDLSRWLASDRPLPNPSIVITMSGGGNRAAALAYAALAELRNHEVPCAAEEATKMPCTLLDNVVLVSGISGGAFTASAFAMNGEAIFSNGYKESVIDLNLGRELASIVWEPKYWRDRTAKIVDIMNGPNILANQTFGELAEKSARPFLLLSGTDVGSGRTFPITQDSLDDLCADLSKWQVAQAVSVAAGLPYATNGTTLENYHATKNCEDDRSLPAPITSTSLLIDQATRPERDLVKASQSRYRLWMRLAAKSGWRSERERPEFFFESTPAYRKIEWLHLFDGGLGDNLGVRVTIDQLTRPGVLQRLATKGAHEIVFIEVNARSEGKVPRYHKDNGQNYFEMIAASAFGPIDRVTELSTYIADEHLNIMMAQLPQYDKDHPCGFVPCIYSLLVDADLLPDDSDGTREKFKMLSTLAPIDDPSFRLIEKVASAALRESPCLENQAWDGASHSEAALLLSRNRGCRSFSAGTIQPTKAPPGFLPPITEGSNSNPSIAERGQRR